MPAQYHEVFGAGNAAALTMTVIAGGTHAVSATLSIKQLA
jgi:hypothetical protein